MLTTEGLLSALHGVLQKHYEALKQGLPCDTTKLDCVTSFGQES